MSKQQIGEKNAPAVAVVIGIILILGAGMAESYSTAVTIISGAMAEIVGFGLLQET